MTAIRKHSRIGRVEDIEPSGRETRRKSSRQTDQKEDMIPANSRSFIRGLPGWMLLLFVVAIILPNALSATLEVTNQTFTALPARVLPILPDEGQSLRASGAIAPLFTPEVQHWGAQIETWAEAYSLDPNMLATIMQIESCGHADISSSAGAQGLFQVMPFHFTSDEVQTDPNTNAQRGASFLAQCIDWADGSRNRAFACYNGGPGVLNRAYSNWAHETQRYYVWGSTIYADAQQNRAQSDSLETWLNAGGASLCQRAADNIDATSSSNPNAVG